MTMQRQFQMQFQQHRSFNEFLTVFKNVTLKNHTLLSIHQSKAG